MCESRELPQNSVVHRRLGNGSGERIVGGDFGVVWLIWVYKVWVDHLGECQNFPWGRLMLTGGAGSGERVLGEVDGRSTSFSALLNKARLIV